MSTQPSTSTPLLRSEITGVILAGGRATRMGGGAKGLVEVGGRTLIEHVIRAVRPQVSDLLINANQDLERHRSFGLTVVTDFIAGYCGPLAGVASAMQVARTPWVLVVPCDAPFVGRSLAARLHEAVSSSRSRGAVACSAPSRVEPMFALLHRDLLPSLLDYLQGGERKVESWYSRNALDRVDCSDDALMFMNLNTQEDVRAAAERLASLAS